MAGEIVIKIALDASDIGQATGKIRTGIKSALDGVVPDAKAIGQKIGNALADGMLEGIAKARQLRTQIDQILSPAQRQKSEEASERAHQQRMAEIQERGAQQQAVIKARAIAQAERDARKLVEVQERIARRAAPPDSAIAFFKRYSSTIREAGESIQQAGYGLLGLTAGIVGVAKASVQSAVDIDRQVNVLKALTGSAQAAEDRFKALVKLSAQTPGLTTGLAATLDAQLRVANVSASTIDKILPAIGRLNAVSPLGDPQKFGQNLVQLITQGFERADLKELVGQSPLAGEIIKSIFNVDSPINGKAIKKAAQKLGITSTDAFFTAFAEAAANNPKLAGITESLGTQFEKLRDRVLVALRPLGLAIVEALAPLVEKVIPVIERLSQKFSELPQNAKQIILVITALAALIGPLVIALGGLLQTFGAFGNLITVLGGAGGLSAIAGGLGALLPILATVGAAIAAFAAAWTTNFGNIRGITADVIKEAEGLFIELRQFWAEIAPDVIAIVREAFAAISDIFKFYSELYGAVWRGGWEIIKTTVREALDVIQPIIKAVLALIRGDFDTFLKEVMRAWSEGWDAFLTIPTRAFASIIGIIESGLKTLLTTTGLARSIGLEIGDNFVQGLLDRFIAFAASPSTAALIRTALNRIRENGASRDQQREATRLANAGRGLDGEEITASDLARNQAFLLNPTPKNRTSLGDGSSSAESKARQLRDALLAQQKTFLEQDQRLLEDANKRELESLKQLYDEKTITAQQYFSQKTALDQQTIQSGITVTQQEIANAEAALLKTKPGTVERIRLETELFKLRTDQTIKSREFYRAEVDNIQATTKALRDQRKELDDQLKSFQVKLDETQLPSALIPGNKPPEIIERARQIQENAAKAIIDFRVQDLRLQEQELSIQNAVNAGILNEAQGKQATLALQREYRDVLIQSLRVQQQALDPFTDGEAFQRIQVQIEQLKTLGQELTPTQGFLKGFRSEAETLAESFERAGKAFKDSILGVVDSGIDKLTSKLGILKGLVGDLLKSFARAFLGNLFQPRTGGGLALGGNGGGGVLGNLFGLLSGGGGGGGGNFLTGGFAGGGGAASLLGGGSGGGGILGALTQSLGFGGASVPRSLSLGGLPIAPNIAIPPAAQIGGGSGGGGILGSLGLNFSGLFKGFGFGQAPGSQLGALASAAPLLGIGLGASLGTDRLTSILGGVAGGLLGVGLTAAPAIIGAGGALSGLGFLAPLFSNPITAIAAGLALPAIFLLGRARQRKRDEKSSGDFLQDAVDQIRDVKKQVESNELTLNVTEARKLFESQILQPFVAQINTLKSKSVRESRLKNQTVDLRNLFEKEVIPAVQAQKARQGVSDKLIPEFALGGIVPGFPTPGIDSVLARMSPGEMVLTVNHQRTIAAMAGGDVFARAGVPNAGTVAPDGSQAFARGGIVSAATQAPAQPVNIIVEEVHLFISEEEAGKMVFYGARTETGQAGLSIGASKAKLNRLKK